MHDTSQVQEILGLNITAKFIKHTLAVLPDEADRKAYRWSSESVALICDRLTTHIAGVAERLRSSPAADDVEQPALFDDDDEL